MLTTRRVTPQTACYLHRVRICKALRLLLQQWERYSVTELEETPSLMWQLLHAVWKFFKDYQISLFPPLLLGYIHLLLLFSWPQDLYNRWQSPKTVWFACLQLNFSQEWFPSMHGMNGQVPRILSHLCCSCHTISHVVNVYEMQQGGAHWRQFTCTSLTPSTFFLRILRHNDLCVKLYTI